MSESALEDLLARFERERVEADRLYNDALTALDRAIQTAPPLPALPEDDQTGQLPALNQSWDILPGGPPALDGSPKGRLRAFVWRLIGPSLEAQKRFNAAVVDHLGRQSRSTMETRRATTALIEAARGQFDALVRFESLLLHYLRTITAYVDTKDRAAGGNELRERIGLIEQRILALKRQMERPVSGGRAPDLGAEARSAKATGPHSGAAQSGTVFSGNLDSVTYVGFEDRFRGAPSEIRARIEDYVPLFASAADVLDVGCGRGELLELLKARGVSARGIDVNHAMVEICRGHGLDVEQVDALTYLDRQGDATLGGLIALQVVEHFEPAYLLKFLELAHHALKPGAPLVLETINPACWMAFFETYIRDLTHQRPLHPDTLRYLVQASGFTSVDVRFRAPIGAADRLERVGADPAIAAQPALAKIAAALDANADKLNARLFSSTDYAVVARR